MATKLKTFFALFIGVRKLFITCLALSMVIVIFSVSLALLIKSFLTGANFVEVVKVLGSITTAVVVGYFSTNMGKHMLEVGKAWIDKRRKKK